MMRDDNWRTNCGLCMACTRTNLHIVRQRINQLLTKTADLNHDRKACR